MLLNDDKGRRRVRLGLTHGGAPRLSMYDRDGVARAALTLDPDGIPNLELRGHKGQSRASIGVSVDGGAYVTLTDRKRPRLSITVTEFATGVYVWDKDLTLRTAVGIGPIRGESSEQMNALTLYGPKGAVIWQAPK